MIEWDQKTLGELTDIGKGIIQTGPFGSQLHASDYVEVGIPCLMPVNLKHNKIDISSVSYVSSKDALRLSKHIVKTGDIIYSRRGDITQKAIITSVEEGFFCGTGCLLIRTGHGVNPIFLLYYLSTPQSISWIKNNAVGITMPNLNTKILRKFPISFPEPQIQQKIASVLTALDSKIELNNRINSELEAMAITLYDYWFVQFDFPDENGKPYKTSGGKMVWNEEMKMEIPEGFLNCKLGDVLARTGTGLNPRENFVLGEGNNYYVTIKNIEQGRVILDNKCDKITDTSLEIINKRSDLKIGDILFTSIEPVGITYLILEKPKNWNINESVFTIRPNYEKVTSEFLYMFLSGDYIKSYTKNVSAGSIHKGIRHSLLKDCKFILPERNIVDAFTMKIQPILNYVDIIQKENQKLTELRDWLLPMLMNGQVKVS